MTFQTHTTIESDGFSLFERPCPLCGAKKARQLFGRPQYVREFRTFGPNAVRCADCGMVYLSPVMTVESYARFYDCDTQRIVSNNFAKYDYRAKTRGQTSYRIDLLSTYLKAASSLMDVGCGYGDFLEVAQDYVEHAIGIEPSSARASAARRRGLKVIHGPIEDSDDAGIEKFDVVTLFQVLEHVLQPLNFLREVRRRLNPGGFLVVEVPNHEDLLVRLKRYRWFYYQNAHCSYFDVGSLSRALSATGFVGFWNRNLQRYGLGNHLHWLLRGRPGNLRMPHGLDELYRRVLSRTRHRDTLFVIARRGYEKTGEGE